MKKINAFLAFLLLPIAIQAMHIIGGEMTYKFVSNVSATVKRYEFTLIVYRDCAGGGAQLDLEAPIAVYQGTALSAVQLTNLDYEAPITSQEDVVPFIPPCTDPSATNNTCAERGVYIFTRDLVVSATQSYFVVFQRCCRTNQIDNIDNPSSFGSTYLVEITPAAMMGTNSSPVFKNYPPTFICATFPIAFDHSATDADGDSLVYVFCNPLRGGGQGNSGGNCDSPTPNPPCAPPYLPVPFSFGYSFDEPMGGNPLIQIDPTTGLLDGVPDLLGKFVVGICVLEYRNGILIGSIQRDFQFNVVDCTPTVIADVLEDSVGLSGELFIIRCGQNPFKIKNISPPSTDLEAWEWEFDLNNGDIFKTSTFNAVVPLPNFGAFKGQLFLNRGLNCPDSIKLTIISHPNLTADFGFSWDKCAKTPVLFTDSSSTDAAGGLTNWNWSFFNTNFTSNLPNPTFDFDGVNGNYLVRLIVTDVNNCRDTAQTAVLWQPAPPLIVPNLPSEMVCFPEKIKFNAFDPASAVGFNIKWDFGDGQTSNLPNPTHFYTQAGIYTVKLVTKSAQMCIDSAAFPGLISIFPSPKAAFNYVFDSCAFSPVQFTDFSKPAVLGGVIATRNWTFFDPNTTSTALNPSYDFGGIVGKYDVQLIVEDVNGCIDTATTAVNWLPVPPPAVPTILPMSVCFPQKIAFEGIDVATVPPGTQFLWEFGDGTTSGDINPTHFYSIPDIYTISLNIFSPPYGCKLSDTFPDFVEIRPKPSANFDYSPKSNISNLNPRVDFLDKSDPSVIRWNWIFDSLGTSIQPSPTFEWPDTGKMNVQLIVENAEGCLDTATQKLDVVPMIRLYFPNVFAPEKSLGVGNDQFGVFGVLPNYSDYELSIWSRWGELLFKTDDPNSGWNGFRAGSGKIMPAGVYTWVLRLKGPRKEPYQFTGDVTLIR